MSEFSPRVFVPPAGVLGLLAKRVFVLWLLTRAVVFGGMAIAQLPITSSFGATSKVVVLVGILFMIDLFRRDERIFFANLGLNRRDLLGGTVVFTLLFEGILALLLPISALL